MKMLGASDVAPLSLLGRDILEQMHAAGRRVQDCQRKLADNNRNVVAEMLSEASDFYQWNHYPPGDVYDWKSHAQYFYHAHPPDVGANVWGEEHGHFHTFLRPLGFPQKVLASLDREHQDNDALSHLVAISMDNTATPIRLFTTNRWVTGETWYAAEDVKQFLPCFDIRLEKPSPCVNDWISSVLVLFRPTIEALLEARDDVIAAHADAAPDGDVYEDRNLEVTSIIDIDVARQLAAIEAAL